MNWGQVVAAFAAAIAICAGISDFRERKIPNQLTYPAMLGGLALQSALHGWRGLLLSVEGGLFFGGVFLLFYVVKAMGAGDVKLAAALGCVVGGDSTLPLMFAIAVAGGLLAIVFMVASGRVIQTLRNTLSVTAFHARHGLQTHPIVNLGNPTAVRMPYGLAFAAGAVYWAVFGNLWR